MKRTGDWIATFTGVKWFITDPHPDDVRIEDIAHALSMVCRYGGHSRRFYSVAQHSWVVANAIAANYKKDTALILHGLLHDATEAYLGDMVRPLKRSMPAYKTLEHVTEGVIGVALGLPVLSPERRAIVKHFDNVALMTERRDLINHCGHTWTEHAEPLKSPIVPMSQELAKAQFLTSYWFLRKQLESEAA